MFVAIFIVIFACTFVQAQDTGTSVYLHNSSWTNELNSQLQIIKAYNGTLIGLYFSGVGDVKGYYRAVGTYSEDESQSILRITFGWSVSWANAEKSAFATTVWSARVIDQNTFSSIWTESRGLERDLWNSVSINKNVFVRDVDMALNK
jgi:hypothetical protein